MKPGGHPQPDATVAAPSPARPQDQPESPSTGEPAQAPLLLAHILRPQGRKGEVLAELFTDFPERFTETPRIYLAKPGFTGSLTEAREAKVLGFFLPVGKNSGRIVLTLEAVDSINAAETLNGFDIVVPHDERLDSEPDAAYISDLIGASVYNVAPTHPLDARSDPATFVGTVDDIHFPTTPDGVRRLEDAAPLLSLLSPTGSEILIPYVKAYLVDLDLEAKRILMALPPGLIEVNA